MRGKLLSLVWLFVTPWIIQSMKFSRPEYWSGLPFPSPGHRPNPGIKPRSLTLQADSLPAEPPGKPIYIYIYTHTHTHTHTCSQFTLLCRRNWHNIVKQLHLKRIRKALETSLSVSLWGHARGHVHTHRSGGCHKLGREAPPETSRAGSLISAAQPLSTEKKCCCFWHLVTGSSS